MLETQKDEQGYKQVKVKYIRDNSGKALAIEERGTDNEARLYYYLYNAHGDVTGLTDSSGNVVATYSYDEFGNLKSSTGTIYNPLRYSGANNAYYDEETGLYKMGARYYNSEVGRWITRDAFKGSQFRPFTTHRYQYCLNDPINKFDETGYWDRDDHHHDWTRNIAYNLHFAYPETLADGARSLDFYPYWAATGSAGHLEWHFDYGLGSGWGNDSRIIFLINRYNWAVRRWKRANKQKKRIRSRMRRQAAYQFGRGLHSLQDRYAHGYIRYYQHTSRCDIPAWPGNPNYDNPDDQYETAIGWPGYPDRDGVTRTRTRQFISRFKAAVK